MKKSFLLKSIIVLAVIVIFASCAKMGEHVSGAGDIMSSQYVLEVPVNNIQKGNKVVPE